MKQYTLDTRQAYGKQGTSSALSTSRYTSVLPQASENYESKNNGGFWGGLVYLREKVGLGFLSGVEGIWDFAAGGIADFIGADEWAEEQFANDWVNYNHADEWYNPSDGWKFAGDIAGGIGTSLPSLVGTAAGAAAIYFSGGAAAPVAVKLIAASLAPTIAGLSAAGNATKEAYRETGELTWKEYGYGFASGITEAALEKVTQGIGTGTGRITKAMLGKVGGTVAKEGAETALKSSVKSTAKTVARTLGKDFLSEGFEEGFAEAVSPIYKRLTYDPDAQFASFDEIMYASVVGGMSGLVMGGTYSGISTTSDIISGNKTVKNGKVTSVMELSRQLFESQTSEDADVDTYKDVRDIYSKLTESIKSTNGEVTSVAQKKMLGELKRANTRAIVLSGIENSARAILADAEGVAQRYSELGMTDANGKSLKFTAEQIRSGIDMNADTKTQLKQLREALSTNSVLSTLAIADAAGRIMMDTKRFEAAAARGAQIASQWDLNYFVEHASEQRKQALGEVLGIEDWNMITHEQFIAAVGEAAARGKTAALARNAQRIRAAKNAVQDAEAVPTSIDGHTSDGLFRFMSESGDINMALIKEGDAYFIYDYDSKNISGENISRQLSRSEVNKILSDYHKQTAQRTQSANVTAEQATESRNAQKENSADVSEQSGNERYSLSKSFAEQIDDVIQGKHNPRLDLYISQTPAVLTGLNFTEGPLLMRNGKIKEILDKHPEMSAELLKKIPDAINDPVLILKSKTHPTESVVIISDILTDKGEMIVPVWINQEGNYIDVNLGEVVSKTNFVASAYGRDVRALLKHANENDGFLYQNPDEKRVKNLIARSGLQLSTPLRISNSTISISQNESKSNTFEEKSSETSEKETRSAETIAIDALARKNIPDYAKLSEPNRQAIRMTIRQARAHGFSEQLVLSAARVSARSGLNIVFDSAQAGSDAKLSGNTIYIDPNASKKRIESRLLLHEGGHALMRLKGGKKLIAQASRKIDSKRKEEIIDRYTKRYEEMGVSEKQYKPILEEEIAAAYIEDTLGDINAWDYILSKEPTFSEKFLSFFREAAKDYSMDENLSSEARKLLRTYKKLFNELSARNQGNNALGSALESRNARKENLTRVNSEKVQDTEDRQALPEDVDNYTEKQYNNFGWVRANNVISAGQYKDFTSKFASAVNDQSYFAKSKSGEYMIPVSDIFDTQLEGIENVIVFAKGTIESPKITRIAEILSQDQEVIDTERREIYETERRGIQRKTSEFLRFHLAVDGRLGRFRYGNSVKEIGNHNELEVQRGRNSTKTKGTAGYQNSKVTGSLLEVVHTFTDVAGRKRNVVRVGSEYMIEGDTNSKYQPSIEAAVNAENERIIKRYSKKSDRTVGWVKRQLENDSDFLKNELKSGVRFALPEDTDTTKPKKIMTVGEVEKFIANNARGKVYSKKSSFDIIERFVGINEMTRKSKEEAAALLWQTLNSSHDLAERRQIAHDFAEFIIEKEMQDSKVLDPNHADVLETLTYLRTGISSLSFSDSDIAEIRHARDEKGLKSIRSRWGYKNRGGRTSRPVSMDVFVADIARQMPGMEHLESMSPVDAFLKIDEMYEKALRSKNDKWLSSFDEIPDSEIAAMTQSIEDEIMNAFDNEGEQSKFAKRFEYTMSVLKERADYWKAEYTRIKGYDKKIGLLMNAAQKMRDIKLGTYSNATQAEVDAFNNSIGKLARIQFRGNFNVGGARNIISDLHAWYTSDAVKTGILEYVDEQNPGMYVQGIADMLASLKMQDGKSIAMTQEDLTTLHNVMSYFTKFVENWGKVFRQGKWVEALPEAERYIDILHANENLKVGLFSRVTGGWYVQTFGDPMTVARRMDMYERGFFTEMMEELRDAAVDAQVTEMEVKTAYDEFMSKNKKFVEKANVETVEYRGVQIPKIQLIGLYMTMKRRHAWAGLAYNGFSFTSVKGDLVRIDGKIKQETVMSKEELEQFTRKELSALEKLLSDTDKEYIAILEKAYNEDTRKLKADRDIQRLGFTNATSDYYYPIRRGNIAKSVDTSINGELDRVSNSSFNKDTVQGAKQELYIESADALFNRHVHAVCQYAFLSPAIETYNHLFNLDISGNKNKPVNIASESKSVWKKGHEFFQGKNDEHKGNKYYQKMISDIQGIPVSSSEGMATLGYIRGSYAKYQLGANPKVWFTQLSSLFAASGTLDVDSIIRGISTSSAGIDEYCSLAKLRNYDNTAAMAQGVLDTATKRTVSKIGRFSDLLMAPIGKMDRFVVGRLFGACQVQVEKNGGGKIGTDENRVEAGKLLRKLILETQQNSIATERSAAMRSGNEVVRTATMFTSDSMKVIGRVIDGVGELSVLKSKLKATTDADTRASLSEQIKAANKKATKAIGALASSAIFMAAIAQLFRWIYDKEQDEDETVAETMLVDAVGNLFGGLPLIKDAYSKLFEGYDVDNYAYSALNDLLDSAVNLFGVAGDLFSKEGSIQERNRALRNMSYSVGQLLGIPTRNVYNVFYGLTKRFNSQAAYKIDSAFYEKNLQNDLYKAIEEDDAEMAAYIMSLLLGERMSEDIDETVFNELLSLSQNGQKVLPRTAPSSVTLGGEKYALSATEQDEIREIYSSSQKSLTSLFSKAKYQSLSDEEKTLAIDYVYDTYYNRALNDVLGSNKGGNALLISDAVGAENLALLYVATKGLESDKDESGKTVSGSKRKKVVSAINSLGLSAEKKLLLLCAKGYSLQDGDIRGLSAANAKKRLLRYILSLPGKTKEEKARIAEMCGFEVRNGRIITKSI